MYKRQPQPEAGTIRVTVGSGPRIDISADTRTALGDDGVTVRWTDGDEIALWGLDAGGGERFSAAPFALWHYNASFGEARFRGDIPQLEAGEYTYLAVSPRLRGQNMGSKALAAFCQGRRVILEIDPPEDEISVRRQHFYQRLGFVANPYAYIHPSFRRPFHPHRLVLMSYPEALTYEEARGFADFIRERVLRYSEHENPELPRL